MIAPQPFTLKCPKCHWSKRIKPKSDAFDMSWGLEYASCPKCGAKTQRDTSSTPLESLVNGLKNIFS